MKKRTRLADHGLLAGSGISSGSTLSKCSMRKNLATTPVASAMIKLLFDLEMDLCRRMSAWIPELSI